MAPVDTTHFVAPYLDITTQMLPWWNLSKDIIQSGHFPFWNIFSGNGLPLMANMQSAIFFPLTWLFYIFSVRFALDAYAFLKLLMMGMFTFLYLRELKLKFSSSLLGAILFAFCNANVIWFLWPLTSVILILPLSFFLIEKYFNSVPCAILSPGATGEESLNLNIPSTVKGSLRSSSDALLVGRDDTKKDTVKSKNGIKYALWLAPVTALGLFAGHPQTFFYIFCAIYGYTIFKCFIDVGEGFKPSPTRRAFKNLLILTSIFFLGFIMSAVAVLPFLEYLKLSANLNYRAGFAENPFYLQPLMFLANLIPDFYGNTGVKNFSYLLVPNYGELALGYIGISGLILALCAFGKKMKKQIWFFIITALFCLALVYHAPIIYQLINKLPGFNLNYNNRLLYLWAFCGSVMAAFGLENILDDKISRKRLNWTFAGFAAFSVLLIIINRQITHGWQFAHNLDWRTVSLWQDVLIAAFFGNLIITYFIFKYLPKKSVVLLLFFIVIAETAIHGIIFMKTSTPANFYPNEPALTYLAKQYQINQGRVFTYGDNLLPNIGTWYRINELNDHDTIYLTSNKQLKTYVANYNYSPEYTFDEPNLNALRFLSVKYLLYPPAQGKIMLQKFPHDLSLAFEDQNYSVLSLNSSFPRAYTLNADSLADLDNQLADLIKNPKSHPIAPAASYQISQDGTEKIAYNMTGDNYLITTDNYYPDWTAKFSSGETEKVQDAFGLRAVSLSPGAGSMTISYQPQSFKLGLEISIASLVIWGALIILI